MGLNHEMYILLPCLQLLLNILYLFYAIMQALHPQDLHVSHPDSITMYGFSQQSAPSEADIASSIPFTRTSLSLLPAR